MWDKGCDELKFENTEDFLKCGRNELVPENPKTGFGVSGLLDYRINASKKINKRHPDSIYEGYDVKNRRYYGVSITAEYFRDIYKINPFEEGSSDTIFNCWSYLSMFARGRLKKRYVSEEDVRENLEYIFDGYEILYTLFNKLADYQHSMANLMPAPVGFNGGPNHDGKGQYDRDNDMPDLYYKRAVYDFPSMYSWINENMEIYALEFFKEYISGFYDGEANRAIKTEIEIEELKGSIERAIKCIEARAENLVELVKIP